MAKNVITTLEKLDGATVTHSVNSQCLRCLVTAGETTVQVEVKVDRSCKVAVLSTATLSRLYNQSPRVINVMAYDVALAHKLGAWYERRLVRDLFDVYLFLCMGIKPDNETLTERLRNPRFSKSTVSGRNLRELESFLGFFKDQALRLSYQDILDELGPILPKAELPGPQLSGRKVAVML